MLGLDGLLADRGAVGLPEWAAVRVAFFHLVVPKTGDTPSLIRAVTTNSRMGRQIRSHRTYA